ncbi:YjfB family protein [Hydrogenophaga sp.]|jgi:hypothetical protein|uniref:YjfB family protein n=1 Tax=Hydrogenophaga sp. TaxID=1904254 RepID=UPI00271ECF55|nr:YjfB family protein [Hydrogenophaga sp.]MDO9133768.1 YjfB family protein [Hydrogenophaga sp.]MDO9604068.1 YjfB family protein [Hydrogenophaga sp.]
MDVSPALLVDRVLQTRNNQTTQDVQISVLKKVMDMQESASAALLNAVAGIFRWPVEARWARR